MTAAAARDVSSKGLQFIAAFEGCVLHPYDDGGRPGVGNATIGVGHLLHIGPVTAADRKKWAGFTRASALGLLRKDAEHCVLAVRKLGHPYTQPQLDALVSFSFNCGVGVLLKFEAIRRQRGDVAACNYLLEFVHANGWVYPGLVRRRHAEALLYLHGVYGV